MLETLRANLYEQPVRCGKANCRYKDGLLHRGYFYLMWREQGRQKKRYVPKRFVPELMASILSLRLDRQRLRDETRQSVASWKEMKGRLKNS